MASGSIWFLGAVLVLAGCADKKSTEPASPPPAPSPPPAALDAAAPVAPDAAVAAAPPPRAGGPCPVAHAATTGACADGTRCVLLLAVDAACTFTVAKELPFSDEIIGDDPSIGVIDLAWPTKDGPLYLVIGNSDPWRWGTVATPLAAPADALAKVTWKAQRVGETEPEGFQYGVESDGAAAYLTGCAKWGDHCSPDAEECEEWHCEKHVFIDAATGKKAARQPRHPFVTAFKGGKVTEAVTLVKRGKDGSTCTAAGKQPVEDHAGVPDAIVPLSATDWLAIVYAGGSRMHARWSADAVYVAGCDRDDADMKRISVGPSKLWAVYEEGGWGLQHGAKAAPLAGSGGATHVGGDGPFVWTAE